MWVGGGDNNSGIKRRLALQGFNGFLVPGVGLGLKCPFILLSKYPII
jgi:hypothetical protein